MSRTFKGKITHRGFRINCTEESCDQVAVFETADVMDATSYAVKNGWHHTEKRGWYCPDCAAGPKARDEQ